jgi:hypothetical protein
MLRSSFTVLCTSCNGCLHHAVFQQIEGLAAFKVPGHSGLKSIKVDCPFNSCSPQIRPCKPSDDLHLRYDLSSAELQYAKLGLALNVMATHPDRIITSVCSCEASDGQFCVWTGIRSPEHCRHLKPLSSFNLATANRNETIILGLVPAVANRRVLSCLPWNMKATMYRYQYRKGGTTGEVSSIL